MVPDDKESPLLEIIIPNWNGAKLLPLCLDSLAAQEYQNFVVTIIDNGSTDDSCAILSYQYPHIRVFSFSENRGFSAAVNEGIHQSRAEWIVLLNNDIELAPDCFSKLVDGIFCYPDADFFALKMYNFYERHLLDGAGDTVLRGGVGYRLGTMESDQERYRVDRPCFGACGGAVLYNRRIFAKIGCFDEDFFAYLEDVDLNMRASLAGLHCHFLADAKVYHIGSATTGSKFNSTTIRLSTRNNIALLIKNYSLILWVRFFPAILFYQFVWLLFCLKKGLIKWWFQGMIEALSLRRICLFYCKRQQGINGYSVRDIWQYGNRIVQAEREAIYSIINRRKEQGKKSIFFQVYLALFC